ncbi:MAG: hypothetical protein ACLFSM_05665, partial [Thermoplasmata archaeon]
MKGKIFVVTILLSLMLASGINAGEEIGEEINPSQVENIYMENQALDGDEDRLSSDTLNSGWSVGETREYDGGFQGTVDLSEGTYEIEVFGAAG